MNILIELIMLIVIIIGVIFFIKQNKKIKVNESHKDEKVTYNDNFIFDTSRDLEFLFLQINFISEIELDKLEKMNINIKKGEYLNHHANNISIRIKKELSKEYLHRLYKYFEVNDESDSLLNFIYFQVEKKLTTYIIKKEKGNQIEE